MEELARKYQRELTTRSLWGAQAFLAQIHPELDADTLRHIVLLAHQQSRDNAPPAERARGGGLYR